MARLLQTLARPYVDRAGDRYDVFLYGDDDGTAGKWRGRLTFVRRADGVRLDTGVETTQPGEGALRDWAESLSTTSLDAAFYRAEAAIHGSPIALTSGGRHQ